MSRDPFDSFFKIPLEDAASYFVKLKTASKLSPEDQKIMNACLEKAAAGLNAPEAPVEDPGSAQAATEEDKFRAFLAGLDPVQRAQVSVINNVVGQREENEPAPLNHAVGGALLGGAAGAGLGALRGKPGAGLGGLAGAGLGALAGAGLGKLRQHSYRDHTADLAATAADQVPTALEAMKFAYAAMTKKAEDDLSESADLASAMVPPGSPQAPGAEAYLAAEMEGRQAEEQNAVQFYADKLRAQAEQMGILQQQVDQLTQQNAASTEQLGGVDNQLMAGEQQSQLAQQAALQQIQQSSQAATDAMSRTAEAEGRVLEAKREAVQRQQQLQQFSQQLLDLADAASTAAAPIASATEMASMGVGAPDAGMNAEGAPPGEAPYDPSQQQAQAGAAGAPNAAPPDAGGTAPGGATPQANSSGETGQAMDETAKRQGQVSIKVGGVVEALGKGLRRSGELLSGSKARKMEHDLRGNRVQHWELDSFKKNLKSEKDRVLGARAIAGTAAAGGVGAAALGKKKEAMGSRMIGALAGGALGAGAAGLEAAGAGPDLDALRGKIEQGEQAMRQPGFGGFAKAYELAKNKVMLTLGEATEEHPVAATITGGLLGAGLGASVGPQIASGLREAKEHWRTPIPNKLPGAQV